MVQSVFTSMLLLPSFFLLSQPDSLPAGGWIGGNNIKARINANGALFTDFEKGQFLTDEEGRSPIRVTGVWIGGMDKGGNLKGAIQMYNEGGKQDFVPGLPFYQGDPSDFNRIWKVTGEDIALHWRDFYLNEIIEDTIPAIFGWPGRGNCFFKKFNGFDLPEVANTSLLAPFEDINLNGMYDPDLGEFPYPPTRECGANHIPAEMAWFTFHDNTLHTESGMYPVNMGINTTAVSFRCVENKEANNTVMLYYKLINHALEDIDNCYFGIFTDFQLGCPKDDYFASFPEQDIFFVYNSDDFDEDCDDYKGYGGQTPLVAMKLYEGPRDEFLSELPLTVLMPILEDAPIPGMAAPETDIEFYNYLTGKWKNGTRLTKGGNGYNPFSTDYTNIIYPGSLVLDSTEWTEINVKNLPRRRRVLASYGPFTLQPGAINRLTAGFTYVPSNDFGHLENLTTVYHFMENAFDFVNSWCSHWPAPECTPDISIPPLPPPPPLPEEFILSPNPAVKIVEVQFRDFMNTTAFSVYDVLGRLILERKDLAAKITFDVSDWPKGVYMARVLKGKERIVKPFVVAGR